MFQHCAKLKVTLAECTQDSNSMTDKQTKSDKQPDTQTEITNRVQIEHISLRTKLTISFNWGKINAIAPE